MKAYATQEKIVERFPVGNLFLRRRYKQKIHTNKILSEISLKRNSRHKTLPIGGVFFAK